ncbi:glutaredoxin domain-containing protein [Neptuniibacter sp. QD37_11]|uniref:glutaredoxin domain-containing protein n=1 Tax=Neptuniibacter sp. QD37_11 TaxID=3398209 RepID=UPI0039F5366D
MKFATIYSKPDCPYCLKAKELLLEHGYEIHEQKIGRDFESKEAFQHALASVIEAMPETVPQIFLGKVNKAHYVGGYDDLIARLVLPKSALDVAEVDFAKFEL